MRYKGHTLITKHICESICNDIIKYRIPTHINGQLRRALEYLSKIYGVIITTVRQPETFNIYIKVSFERYNKTILMEIPEV